MLQGVVLIFGKTKSFNYFMTINKELEQDPYWIKSGSLSNTNYIFLLESLFECVLISIKILAHQDNCSVTCFGKIRFITINLAHNSAIHITLWSNKKPRNVNPTNEKA